MWTFRCRGHRIGDEFATLREAIRWYAENLFDHPAAVRLYYGRQWFCTYHPERHPPTIT
jgi:hypothetical protein